MGQNPRVSATTMSEVTESSGGQGKTRQISSPDPAISNNQPNRLGWTCDPHSRDSKRNFINFPTSCVSIAKISSFFVH